jgi:FkbM family methyltransferase
MSPDFKNIALKLRRFLPPVCLRALRRRYYLRVVENYAESDWEWSPFIKPIVSPGSQVLDIGANVGYLSGLFARWVGPTGCVTSIEPIPATYDALTSSMKQLYPDTVTTIQCCVSDAPGDVTMSVPSYAGGGENYYESRIVEASATTGSNLFTVQATTLDLLIPNLNLNLNPNLSLIKIDVEGHELAVIRGGADYLSRQHPPLLIEVAGNPDEPGTSASLLFTTLKGWGYTPHLIRKGTLEARQIGDRSVDYLFLTIDHRP